MARKRQRYRASDLAPTRRNPFVPMVLLIVGLVLILLYKRSTSDDVASLLEGLTVDPDLVLPASVLERDAAPAAADGGA